MTLMATQVNIYEAKTKLSSLIAQVEAGEEIVIARHGRPVAKLVPFSGGPARRVPGAWKGRVWIADDFDQTDEQTIDDWYGGSDEDLLK